MKPLIILSFANDKDDYLPMVIRERKNIFKTLQNHHDKGYVQVHKEENTSIADIFDLFNHYNDRIVVFHYGGHAGSTHLQLETQGGESQLADAVGLAQLMGQQKKLQLVFLNGCATRKQVDLLLSNGVKAVIATSVPIQDQMATEFAEQFYNALASQATLEKAFQVARAFVSSKYGTGKNIQAYTTREISWEGKEETPTDQIPWGLYSSENTPEVLDWKLPFTNQDSIIIRGAALSDANQVPVNTNLIETLFKEVAAHSIEVGYLMEAYKRSQRMDIRMVRQAIIDSFPAPVGEQLRRLFAGNSVDVPRLRQLVATYETTIQLLCFTMLSQLWEAKYKNPDLVIEEDQLVQFNSFFALNVDNYQTFNYFELMETIAWIFQKNKIQYFIEELNNLGECLLANDCLNGSYLFMEEMKRELMEENIKADEIESFCIQAENHLCNILKILVFIVKYKLTTIKRIEIIKRRHKQPQYRHTRAILDRVTAGILDETTIYNDFADTDSVVLLKNTEDMAHFLSLSPFIIDENALTGHQNSKLFFYSHQDTSDSHYYYKFIDNEAEKLAVKENYPQVTEQLEEFRNSIFQERAA